MPVGDWGAYEKFVADLMTESHLPGVAVAVARDGQTVYANAFGYRNQAEQLPITTKTALGIGSVTKSFTSLGIMLLVEDKKLSVEDPVTRWLPEFRIAGKEAANRMTLHHLLTHTSGMPPLPTVQVALARSLRDDPDLRDTPQYAELQKLEPVDTVEELIEYVNGLDVTLLGYPGVYSSYSNEGFALLGLVIQRASGKPYEQFMQERVLDPLGMIHTTFDPESRRRLPEITLLYERRGDEVHGSDHWWEAPAHHAAGSHLVSNTNEMLKYLDLYRTGGLGPDGTRLISEQNLNRLSQPHARFGYASFYGYGLAIHPNYHGVSLVEHGGGAKGVSAQITLVPEKGITAVALANMSGAPSARIVLGAVNQLLELPLNTPRHEYADYQCPADRLERYVGDYRSMEGAAVSVAREDSGLRLTMGEEELKARPIAVDTFAVKYHGSEMPVIFMNHPAGDVWAMYFGSRVVLKATQ